MAENDNDNGYETDNDNYINQDQDQNSDITEDHYLLLKKFILETTKPNAYKLSKMYNPEVESISQLFNQIIQHKLITYYQLHPDFTKKPYNDGSISDCYLHIHEIDKRMYEFFSPHITKEEYDTLNSLYPSIKEVDYGSKFIETIKFYHNFIIIILPLNERILKIDRINNTSFGLPILTVYEGGHILILDWNPPTNSIDPTQFSKLVFTKTGIISDIYWTDSCATEYRDEILPSHIALRPNRFNNCWYLDYNTHVKLPDDTIDIVKFSIHCCDS